VLSRGTVIGFRAVTPTGGHCAIYIITLTVSLIFSNA
jgi:hypothetical protein